MILHDKYHLLSLSLLMIDYSAILLYTHNIDDRSAHIIITDHNANASLIPMKGSPVLGCWDGLGCVFTYV